MDEEKELASHLTFLKLGGLKTEHGRCVLTDQRLFFIAKAMLGPGGLIGQAFSEARANAKGVLFDIPLTQITAVRRGKQGPFNKKILEVDAGGQTYVVLDAWQHFADPLRAALAAAGRKVEDTNDGPLGEGWKVS